MKVFVRSLAVLLLLNGFVSSQVDGIRSAERTLHGLLLLWQTGEICFHYFRDFSLYI